MPAEMNDDARLDEIDNTWAMPATGRELLAIARRMQARAREEHGETIRWSSSFAHAVTLLAGLVASIDAVPDKPGHEGEAAKDFYHSLAFAVIFLNKTDAESGRSISALGREVASAAEARIAQLVEALKAERPEGHYECEDCYYSCPKHEESCNSAWDNRAREDRPCECGRDARRERIDAALSATSESAAEFVRARKREQREKDAKIVEGWHIKKGGYGNLAAAIRAQEDE